MKILIGKLRAEDSTQMAKLANNKRVWDNLRDMMPHPYSKEDAESFINLTKRDGPQLAFGIVSERALVYLQNRYIVHR